MQVLRRDSLNAAVLWASCGLHFVGTANPLLRNQGFCGHFVAPGKHPRQPSPGVSAGNELPQPAKRKFVLHAILQPTLFSVRNEQMGVFPAPERPGDHDVPKHPSRLMVRVLSSPRLGERPHTQPYFYSRPSLFNPACALDHACVFPRRRQPLKCIRKSVPAIHLLR
jgi:hypothetical protein